MDLSYNVEIGGRALQIKRPDKVFDSSGITKAKIIEYYKNMSPFILPHITDKPFSMIHFPDGVNGKSFYQKRKPENAPGWLSSIRLGSSSGHIDWCLVNDTASIIYMANRGVIEMHTFFSRLPSLNMPDAAVIDLDPSGNTGFKEAAVIARAFEVLLGELKLFAVPKTSGGTGIHIYIPVFEADFGQVQEFLAALCRIVESAYPNTATTERTIAKRGNKIYLDAVQNAYGKTIAAPYSLRAREGLPFSAPLLWEELKNPSLSPFDFNINNINERIEKVGDLFDGFYLKAQKLPKL